MTGSVSGKEVVIAIRGCYERAGVNAPAEPLKNVIARLYDFTRALFLYPLRYLTGSIMTNEIIIVSTPYLSGYKITKTIGFTWGLIVRSRGLGRNITAGLRSIIGGEIHEYTELLNQSREQALDRLKEHARALGANAVVSVEFDSSEIGQTMTELLAYGTAVIVEKDEVVSSPVRLG
jgi:uncharacterized protein YbjQ (UPF0145 family)